MLGWHLWLSTHLFSLGKCDATQFLHHIGRLATAPANLQPSSRLQPMHPWSPPQLGHPWALSSSEMWANMIKASVTTAHLSYRFPILKLPPPPCAVLLVRIVNVESGWICFLFEKRTKWMLDRAFHEAIFYSLPTPKCTWKNKSLTHGAWEVCHANRMLWEKWVPNFCRAHSVLSVAML